MSKLTAHQILALCPATWDDHDLGPAVALHLTETKGLHGRYVRMPTWLLRELDSYIKSERADAVKATPKGQRSAKSLLVNSQQSHAHVGKNITADTLQHAFHRAVIAAGLVKKVTKTDPDTDKQYIAENQAIYSFHDLRHTFAIAIYWTETHRGNREPWKIVQALLGHKSLSTTLKFYIAITPSFEYEVSDIMYKWHRNLTVDTV